MRDFHHGLLVTCPLTSPGYSGVASGPQLRNRTTRNEPKKRLRLMRATAFDTGKSFA